MFRPVTLFTVVLVVSLLSFIRVFHKANEVIPLNQIQEIHQLIMAAKSIPVWESQLYNGSLWPANTRVSNMLRHLEKKPSQLLDELLQKNQKPNMDDPRLVDIVRMLIHPPARGLMKRSNVIRATPQAGAVIKILGNKKGFFVECGALDGERASNTLYLETKKKWSGLLVEMDPLFFLQLLGKNRNSHALHACLSPHPYPENLDYKESEAGIGKLQGGTGSKVTCLPLYSIMLALGQSVIDYFSLDVEGQELHVLQTIPFDKLDIKILSVEYNHLKGGDKEVLQKYMTDKGYKVYKDIKFVNAERGWYVNDFIFAKPELLQPDKNR